MISSGPVLTKEQCARAACLFFAEELRSNRLKIGRAAEMAKLITQNMNLVDTDLDFLVLLENLGASDDAFLLLHKRIKHLIQKDTKTRNETLVHKFVLETLPFNSELARKILHDSVDEGLNLESLCVKYPQLRQFVNKNA